MWYDSGMEKVIGGSRNICVHMRHTQDPLFIYSMAKILGASVNKSLYHKIASSLLVILHRSKMIMQHAKEVHGRQATLLVCYIDKMNTRKFLANLFLIAIQSRHHTLKIMAGINCHRSSIAFYREKSQRNYTIQLLLLYCLFNNTLLFNSNVSTSHKTTLYFPSQQ